MRGSADRWRRGRGRGRRSAAPAAGARGGGRGSGRTSRPGRTARWRRAAPRSRPRRPVRTAVSRSARAPTSTAWVGSCSTSSTGSTESHFAKRTFCWLPPLSSLTRSAPPRVLMPSRWIASSVSCSCQARETNHGLPLRATFGSARLSRTLRSAARPSRSRRSGTMATPAARHLPTFALVRSTRPAEVVITPPRGADRPRDQGGDLFEPGAGQPGHADDLAGPNRDGERVVPVELQPVDGRGHRRRRPCCGPWRRRRPSCRASAWRGRARSGSPSRARRRPPVRPAAR